MSIKLGGRQYGKSHKLLCERISELELQIDFAKKFNLPYELAEQELNSLYIELNGGENRVKEKPNSATRKTSKQKNKNNA